MHNYLALGDSYTIGEGVMPELNFPNQIAKKLRARNIEVSTPKIIAVTGWTTAELKTAIATAEEAKPLDKYTFSTLLIGVNNQYRGQDIAIFKKEFTELLSFAIEHTIGGAKNVYVLSIPDWGVTPFAKEKDSNQIAEEISNYNNNKKAIAENYNCHFIDITPSTIAHGNLPEYLVEDLLHYNDKEYEIWAQKASDCILKNTNF